MTTTSKAHTPTTEKISDGSSRSLDQAVPALSGGASVADPDAEAIRLAFLNGRDWNDMGNFERERYRDEARKVECDCCGQKFTAEEVSFIPAARAAGAGCDTNACESCRGWA